MSRKDVRLPYAREIERDCYSWQQDRTHWLSIHAGYPFENHPDAQFDLPYLPRDKDEVLKDASNVKAGMVTPLTIPPSKWKYLNYTLALENEEDDSPAEFFLKIDPD